MRIPTLPIGLRGLAMLAAAFIFTLAVVDAGSIMLTRMSAPDDVRSVGHTAAAAAADRLVSRQTARQAFEAAQADARGYGIEVSPEGFTLYPDGRVKLTAGKTAPTVLLDRVEALRHFAEVRATVTVEKLPFS